jgi:hypothetical protein
MSYEMKPGQGSAFKSDDKKEEWHADFRGKVMLPSGETRYIDITKKKTKAGDTWLAVKIGNHVGGASAKPALKEDMKDDIPW